MYFRPCGVPNPGAAPGSHDRHPLNPCPGAVCRGVAGEAGGKEGSGEKPGEENAGSQEWLPGRLGSRKSRTEKWPLDWQHRGGCTTDEGLSGGASRPGADWNGCGDGDEQRNRGRWR